MKRPTLLRRLPLIRSIRSARGQSLVEFTILLPVLLIMISGLIEFGFMLNYYLDVIDAAREATRWGAGDDPVHCDPADVPAPCLPVPWPAPPNPTLWTSLNPSFYGRICAIANQSIDVGSGGQIDLDATVDDIVISAFSVSGGTVSRRFPPASLPAVQGPETGYSCMRVLGGAGHDSQFTTAEVQALLIPGAPNTGVVMVEMWYDYNMILGLPWITAFVPNPVTLYAYSMMPNANVEPTPTP
jgi:hypothetical protein